MCLWRKSLSERAITDELDEGETGFLVERALDEPRSVTWPHTDPKIELFRKGKR